MDMTTWAVSRFLLAFLVVFVRLKDKSAQGTQYEKLLREQLFAPNRYDKSVRPVMDPNQALNVSFGLRLSKLVKLDTKQQLLVTDVWIVQKWKNPFLTWNESAHGGVHSLHLSVSDVWVPDIVLYNNGDTDLSLSGFTEKFKTYIIVDSSGTCTWMSPTTFKSSCNMDITKFPYDSHECHMTFGSWTYDIRLLQMYQLDKKHSFAEKFVENGDWNLRAVTIERKQMKYGCCAHPFSDVTYTFTLDRKPTYHILYLVMPCIIIAALSIVNFYLPPDCGERIGLCITILLAMSVYLLLVSDILPETSDYTPLLGIYYMTTMVLVALCIAATAITLKCHHGRGKPPKLLMLFGGFKEKKQPRKNTVLAVETCSELKLKEKNTNHEQIWKNGLSRGESSDEGNEELWKECWVKIAERLDKVFLFVFTAAFLTTTLGTLIS